VIFHGKNIDPVGLAWAGGFLEGEGCFTLYQRRPGHRTYYIAQIAAAQVDNVPLLRLKRMFGGNIHLKPRKDERHRDIWYWEVGSAQTLRKILPLVIPYLSRGGNKVKQARLLLEFCRTIDSRRGALKISEQEHEERMSFVTRLAALKRVA